MRIKLGVLFIVSVIASAGMGVSYAVTNGEFNTNGVCYPDVEFTDVSTSDNEYVKEVADVDAQIVNAGRGIDVDISNAYPGYEATINFTIMNIGDCPIYVSGVSVWSSDSDAVEVTVVPDITVGTWLYYYGDTIVRDLVVLITQDAEQGTPYQFNVTIDFDY